MKFIYNLSLLMVLIGAAQTFGMQVEKRGQGTQGFIETLNKYNGTPITPETLLQLQEVPERMFKVAGIFAQRNPALIQQLVYERPQFADLKTQHVTNQQVLKEHGFENLSPNGFGYRVDIGDGVIAKFAGHIHSTYNLKVGALGEHFNTPAATLKDKLEKADAQYPTYQGTSRVSWMLRAKQWAQENPEGAQYFNFKPSYVYSLNGTDCSDRASFVVQEKLPVETYRAIVPADITADNLPHIISYMKNTNAWGFPQNMSIDEDGKICVYNYQQPNNTDPRIFYFKNIENDPIDGDVRRKAAWNAYVAFVQEFNTFLKNHPNPEIQNQFIELLNNDSDLKEISSRVNIKL